MTPEQTQEILALRGQSLTSKEIARKLGLRPAEVTAIIRSHGEQAAQDGIAHREMSPIYECLVSGNFPDDRFLAAGEKRPAKSRNGDDLSMGLTSVVVARKARPGKLMVCNYLVDYNCLGVKNVLGPKQVAESNYPRLKSKYYSIFDDEPKPISLEQAQAIVFSSVAYAEGLNLHPHRDFNEAARAHLGHWEQKLTIWCGDRDGKPMFIAGPYDSPTKIMGILDRSVGKGNYNFIAPADMF